VRALAVGVTVLLLAGCGSSKSATPVHWDGSLKPSPDGSIDPSAFNDFLAGDGKAYASSPVAATSELLRLDRTSAAETTVEATSPGEVRNFSEVVATLAGLQDDSVRDARYTVELQRGADDLWRVRAIDWAQRCQAGRGHQNFAAQNCV
jgi:hypothetical protein